MQHQSPKHATASEARAQPARPKTLTNFPQPLLVEQQWQLIDVQGRVLRNGQINAGASVADVDVHDISAGCYYLGVGGSWYQVVVVE